MIVVRVQSERPLPLRKHFQMLPPCCRTGKKEKKRWWRSPPKTGDECRRGGQESSILIQFCPWKWASYLQDLRFLDFFKWHGLCISSAPTWSERKGGREDRADLYLHYKTSREETYYVLLSTAPTHTHTHARTRTRAHTQTRAHTHTYSHIHTNKHAHTHAHTHTHTHTQTRAHTHIHTHTHLLTHTLPHTGVFQTTVCITVKHKRNVNISPRAVQVKIHGRDGAEKPMPRPVPLLCTREQQWYRSCCRWNSIYCGWREPRPAKSIMKQAAP